MKTTEQIFNEILAEKQNYPELDQLNSTSKVSIWRLWIWIFAFFSKTLWELFEDLKNWVKDYFAKHQAGSLQWWIDQIKAFQYGDQLTFIDGVWKYENIDTEKQIVKQAAIEPMGKILLIKVAKEVNGQLTPLSEDEKQALEGYLNKIKFPGQFIQVISENPDQLKINLRIYYNPEIPQAILRQQIEKAINDYLSNIVFNGKFVGTELIDRLQQINGVVNPILLQSYYSTYNFPYWQPMGDYMYSAAGWFELNELNIEFVPNV